MDSGWWQVALAAGGLLCGLVTWAARQYLESRIGQVRQEVAVSVETMVGGLDEHLRRCEEERRQLAERAERHTLEFVAVCRDYARTSEQTASSLRSLERLIESETARLLQEIDRWERSLS